MNKVELKLFRDIDNDVYKNLLKLSIKLPIQYIVHNHNKKSSEEELYIGTTEIRSIGKDEVIPVDRVFRFVIRKRPLRLYMEELSEWEMENILNPDMYMDTKSSIKRYVVFYPFVQSYLMLYFPDDYYEKKAKGETDIPGIVLYQLHTNDLDFGGNVVELSPPESYLGFVVNRYLTKYPGGSCGLYTFYTKRKSGFNIEYWYPDVKQYSDSSQVGFSMSKIYFDTLDNTRQFYDVPSGTWREYLDIKNTPFMDSDRSKVLSLIHKGKKDLFGVDVEYKLARAYKNINGRYVIIPEIEE